MLDVGSGRLEAENEKREMKLRFRNLLLK